MTGRFLADGVFAAHRLAFVWIVITDFRLTDLCPLFNNADRCLTVVTFRGYYIELKRFK